jgi:hypothetical protein
VWLHDFQRAFGEVLVRPLDPSSGTFQSSLRPQDAVRTSVATPGHGKAFGLAVYQRMRTFRFFETLQKDFPLLAALLGPWRFNLVAQEYLRKHPPEGPDIGRLSQHFPRFLDAFDIPQCLRRWPLAVPPPRQALMECVRVDEAWREVLTSSQVSSWVPRPEEASALHDLHLARGSHSALVRETWPWLRLRGVAASSLDETGIAMPDRHREPLWVLLLREEDGILQWALEPLDVLLLNALETNTVADALAHVEAACNEGDRERLPARAGNLLQEGIRRGLWTRRTSTG